MDCRSSDSLRPAAFAAVAFGALGGALPLPARERGAECGSAAAPSRSLAPASQIGLAKLNVACQQYRPDCCFAKNSSATCHMQAECKYTSGSCSLAEASERDAVRPSACPDSEIVCERPKSLCASQQGSSRGAAEVPGAVGPAAVGRPCAACALQQQLEEERRPRCGGRCGGRCLFCELLGICREPAEAKNCTGTVLC